ncbi:hypothetical protein E9531_16270 [Lampropedia puyangensis]|uniref:Uncharacterized protein n=1 Tax=Lampropedia puyangensis TaxID=1330072 RepID=A0A4S8EQ56_9BURK|nr:hypothetical protein [Lampropedia puyangensis]THT96446.1 hypothetical protein E9531_16270 [Lampropedia puyangensis]
MLAQFCAVKANHPHRQRCQLALMEVRRARCPPTIEARLDGNAQQGPSPHTINCPSSAVTAPLNAL